MKKNMFSNTYMKGDKIFSHIKSRYIKESHCNPGANPDNI